MNQPKRNVKNNADASSNAKHDTDDEQFPENTNDLSPSTFDVLFYTLFLPMVLILIMGKSWMPQEQPYANYFAASNGGGDISVEADVVSSEFMAPSPVSSNKEDLPTQGFMSEKQKVTKTEVESMFVKGKEEKGEVGGKRKSTQQGMNDGSDEKGDDTVPTSPSNVPTASENAIGKDRNGTKVNSRAFYNSYVKRPQSGMKASPIGDERRDNVSKKIDSLRQRVDNNSGDVQVSLLRKKCFYVFFSMNLCIAKTIIELVKLIGTG